MTANFKSYKKKIEEFRLGNIRKFQVFYDCCPSFKDNIDDCIDYAEIHKDTVLTIFGKLADLFEELEDTVQPLSFDAYRIEEIESELQLREEEIRNGLDDIKKQLKVSNSEEELIDSIYFDTMRYNTLNLLEDPALIEYNISVTGYEKQIDALLAKYGDAFNISAVFHKSVKEKRELESRIENLSDKTDFSGIPGSIGTIFNYFKHALIDLKTISDLKYHLDSVQAKPTNSKEKKDEKWFSRWLETSAASFDNPQEQAKPEDTIEKDKLIQTAIFHLNKIRNHSYYHSPALDILKTKGVINRDVALKLMFEVIDRAVIKPMVEETFQYLKE